jgi:hypothetical protein
MSERGHTSSTHALLIYAALGVALGMVAWAVFVHDGSSSREPRQLQTTLHTGETK